MQKCVYAEQVKCKSCTHVFYQQCSKFKKAYNQDLVRELIPMQFKRPKKSLSKNVVWWSKNEQEAKSAAAIIACVNKRRVKKVTANQAITIVLGNEEFSYEMVFLDCKNARPDLDKVLNCLVSFVDKCVLQSVPVVISLQGSNIAPNQDWKQC